MKLSYRGKRIAAFMLALLMFCTTALAAYDPNFDYSAALADPTLDPKLREEYEKARAEKIADMYNGEEPPLDGGDGSTFSEHYEDVNGDGHNEYTFEVNFNGSGLTDDQAEIANEMMEAASNGKVDINKVANAIDQIKDANENETELEPDSDAVKTYLDVKDYEDNKNNKEEAVVAIMGNYWEKDPDTGSPIWREGGIVYTQDENGKWLPNPKYDREPDAVELSDDALNEILYAKEQWEQATTQVEKDYWSKYANDVRENNGYNGGHDGSFFNKDGFGTGGQNDDGNGDNNGGGGRWPYPPNPDPTPNPTPQPSSYGIYAYSQGEGSITPAGWTYYSPGAYSETYVIRPASGWKLQDVIVDSRSAMSKVTNLGYGSYTFDFGTVTSSHTIKAIFVEVGDRSEYFGITANTNTGGTISNPGYTAYKKGSTATYTITPDDNHYIFDVFVSDDFGISKSIGATRSVVFENIDRNYTVEVVFQKKDNPGPGGEEDDSEDVTETFTITATAGANGSITNAGTQTFTKGSNISYTITPNTGYKIEDLKVDGTKVTAAANKTTYTYTFNNLTASHTISVTFRNAGAITGVTGITVGSGGKTETTKSGYGIGCEVKPDTTNARITQVVCVNSATGKSFVMEYDSTYNKWVMPKNPDSKVEARVDYLPADLPDGEYKFTITVHAVDAYDGSAVASKSVEVKYTVDGSMYEDDFTGDRR